jgi:hypothetical protein
MIFKRVILFVLLCAPFRELYAQLLTELGEHHNQLFVGSGYTESFANITYGINHTRYFKRLKRDIVGILDFTSPISNHYFTRFIFRKGFQLDAYKRKNFRIPVALITSSVKKQFYLFAFHDIITDLYILPGIYTPKYTIAADISFQFLVRHKVNHHDQASSDSNMKLHRTNVSAGIVLVRNVKRFSFIFRGGFQQISYFEFTKAPIYAIGSLAYKFNFTRHQTPAK